MDNHRFIAVGDGSARKPVAVTRGQRRARIRVGDAQQVVETGDLVRRVPANAAKGRVQEDDPIPFGRDLGDERGPDVRRDWLRVSTFYCRYLA